MDQAEQNESKAMSRSISMTTRMVVSFLTLAIVPLAALGFVTYHYAARFLKDEAHSKLTAVRDLKARTINRWLEETASHLEGVAELLRAQDVDRFLSGSLPAEEQAALRDKLRRTLEHHGAFLEVAVISARTARIEISTTRQREGIDRSQAPYFYVPVKTGQSYVSDVYLSPRDRVPVMEFATPLRTVDHSGGQVVGVVTVRIDLDKSLYRVLLDRAGLGKTGETFLVNRERFALSELRWQPDAPLRLKIAAEPVRLATQGEHGTLVTQDYRGQETLAAYAFIPRTGWGLVAKQDLAELHGPVARLFDNLILAGMALSLLVLLAAIFAGRAISRPVLDMSRAARKIETGDLSARCSETARAELGLLGRSLNAMAGALVSQVQVERDVARLSEVALRSSSVEELGSEALRLLMELSGAPMGAFYRRESDRRTFRHLRSVGLESALLGAFNAGDLEGELGRPLITGKLSRLTGLPESTRFRFKTVVGEVLPRELVTLPLVVKNEVRAFLSLASVEGFSPPAIKVLEQCQTALSAALANLLGGEELERMAEELRVNNEELQANNEELQAQSEELRAQADELRELADRNEEQRQRLKEADRLKSEFLSNMSHELRTPLNSILALSQLMLSRGPGKKMAEDGEFLKIIERNGRQLLRLINDILDLAKIEAGYLEVSPRQVNPGLVVESAVQTVRPLAEEKKLALSARVEDTGPVRTDEDRLNQILVNLLMNAVKYTDAGEVELRLTRNEDTISFAVQDTGIGISEVDQTRIFDEFRQVDGSATRRHGGTGLGLAICQKLARLLGGRVAVQSALGQGSTFTLTLPRGLEAQPGPETIPTLPAARPAPARNGKRQVLIIEDSPDLRHLMQEYLGRAGYEAVVAADGQEGLRLAPELSPLAITVDLVMPGTDGWEVLARLKADRRTRDVPVIVLSAMDLRPEDKQRLARTAHRIIQKGGSEPQHFLQQLQSVLAGLQGPSVEEDERTPRILLVEDNEVAAAQIRAAIEECGFSVSVAENGAAALARLKEAPPAGLVLDLMMPGVDGFELLERLRASPETAELPVLVLTAKDLSLEERLRLQRRRVHQLAQKGMLSREELTSCVRELVRLPRETARSADAAGEAPAMDGPDAES